MKIGGQEKPHGGCDIYVRSTSDSSVVKNPPCQAGDTGSIPWSGRSPGGGNGNPLQYSCLTNPMDEEPVGLQYKWFKVSDTTEPLSTHHRTSRG